MGYETRSRCGYVLGLRSVLSWALDSLSVLRGVGYYGIDIGYVAVAVEPQNATADSKAYANKRLYRTTSHISATPTPHQEPYQRNRKEKEKR